MMAGFVYLRNKIHDNRTANTVLKQMINIRFAIDVL